MPKQEQEEEKRYTLPNHKTPRFTPFTAPWVVERLKDQPEERAVPILRIWAHPKRHREINRQTIDSINKLNDGEAVDAIEELKEPRVFIRGTRGSKLSFKANITTLDTRAEHEANALLDSGCEGSCIDIKYVRRLGLNTTKLARPIPVLNADGQPNSDGPITELISLEVRIGSHKERVDFGVTNLGKGEIFLGHDWLNLHNPSIDWREGIVEFNRCPFSCLSHVNSRYTDFDFEDDEDDEEEVPILPPLEEGERLFMVDPTPAVNIRASTNKAMELAIKANEKKPKKPWNELVPEYLHEYEEVFTKHDFEELPPSRPWDHAIELLPGAEQRLDCKIYPLSDDEQEQLDKFIEEHLRTGRIRPSKSPMASPFFFSKKKDGALRPIQDYRRLNDITVKNRYPLPLITELIDTLQNAKYFTKLDVRWGYNNVRIKEGDEFKAAFRTNRGLFEPLVMFFGLTNSPATFQNMMNDIFHVEVSQGHVLIYLDDILIFDKDLDAHHQHVREVLERLREHKLYLKPEKCEFDVLEVEYLGVIVSEGKVRMDPVKVEGITDWPAPQCKRDVQSFLGFCNFYRRFIHHYAGIARPLNILTGNTPFNWTSECQEAFEKLKMAITTAPILIIPNNHDKLRLECDASEYALGAVLSQHQDGKWKPAGFISKAFNPTQRNYEVYDRELLAIMTALHEFRKHLMTAKQIFEVWTDHANLQYFKKPQKLNRRQARWLTELQEFHFTLHHIPGKQNSKADILSRRPGFEKGTDDNDDTTLLPPVLFSTTDTIETDPEPLLLQRISHELAPITFLPRILRSRNNLDERVKKMINRKESGWKTLDDGTMTFKDRVYVPKDKTLRGDIISQFHDNPLSGHYGHFKTAERILRDYWWPSLHHDIKTYVDGCETCQRTKAHRIPAKTPLHPFEPPSRPWEVVTIDLIGPLPECQGYNAVFTIVDWFSKSVKFEPAHLELKSEGCARILRDRVIRDHGLPRRMIHDRDTRFVSKYITELFGLLGIKQNPSTAYHPQTDGQTERMNQIVEQYLRIFINYRQDDWKEWLPMAEFSYNNSVHAATQQTPFFINYGQHPWTGEDTRREVRNESATEFANRMKKVRQEAKAALRQAAERMKDQYDKHARPSIEYSPGDKVYLESTNLKTNRPSKKLDDKRLGPFEVVKKVGPAAYKLKLPSTWPAIHPQFNEQYLSPHKPAQYRNQQNPPPPPPIEVEEGIEYAVESIKDSRRRRGKLQYLVHWEGYPREEDTWEPVDNVKNAPELIDEFHRLNPRRPSPTNNIRRLVKAEYHDGPKATKSQDISQRDYPRIYDEETGIHGEGYVSPKPIPNIDVILPLTPGMTDQLLLETHKILPQLPKETRRVWIYETEPVNAVTQVIRLGERHIPIRLYQLLDPLTKRKVKKFYGCLPPDKPRRAPPWINRDYSRYCQCVWQNMPMHTVPCMQ
jgi:RNase H-like domain found in reverse transcriptase/Reverse transcriptase (RNA-dependent DNA polymerase)/Integrase zinc binding domain/Chromo (CHRromatin Organisation MOdifier) domain